MKSRKTASTRPSKKELAKRALRRRQQEYDRGRYCDYKAQELFVLLFDRLPHGFDDACVESIIFRFLRDMIPLEDF